MLALDNSDTFNSSLINFLRSGILALDNSDTGL